jgi:hypothetical protein
LQRAETTEWLAEFGFRKREVTAFAPREGGGIYFDVLYQRR